jgi:hypothetical protein
MRPIHQYYGEQIKDVGFEVLTAVVMKSSIFWDITPCSPLNVKDVSGDNVASIFRAKNT